MSSREHFFDGTHKLDEPDTKSVNIKVIGPVNVKVKETGVIYSNRTCLNGS